MKADLGKIAAEANRTGMISINGLALLYAEETEEKYKTAARKMWKHFNIEGRPRLNTFEERHQTWLKILKCLPERFIHKRGQSLN